ncbi:lactadherin-like [Oculina patagonica]
MASSTGALLAVLLSLIHHVKSDCSLALGMATGDIRDSQITASSSNSKWTQPSAGRLWNRRRIQNPETFGGWCAMDWDDDPYLQIDFGQETVITQVATQGLDLPFGNWVKKYSLNYSCDGMNWKTYRSFNKDTALKGNSDGKSVKRNKLDKAIIARVIRIRALEWNAYGIACMRAEVYGCNTQDGWYKDCSAAAGLESRQIPDKQVTASSFFKGHHPSQGRLNNQVKQVNDSALWGSWCADTEDISQYIQVDLTDVQNISGVATQGSSMGTWVTEYMLNYSLDGIRWKTYCNQSGEAKILQGNWDEMTVHKNMFEQPISARYVRFNPRAWRSLGQICMRMEIYLCQVYQGCSRSTERLPTTSTAVSSNNKLSVTRNVAPATKVNAFTQQENPTFTSVIEGLYSKGFRTTETWTTWLMIAWLLLLNVVIE